MTLYEVTTPASMATYVNRRAPVAWFSSVSGLLADTTLAYAAGTITVSENDVVGASGYLYRVAASGASDEHVTTAGGVKLYVLPGERGLNAYAFGMPTGGDDQTLMDILMNSDATAVHFPPGVYQAYLNNSVSGRTLHFDEGAIIDGVVHIAVGTGPDTHAVGSITWTDDTRAIGTVVSTVRVGTSYARKVNIDKIRITEVDAGYVNQTAEGGTNGVHFYVGSKDIEVGEIICDSATDGVYALGVDRAATVDADSKPENIHIGRLIVRNNTQSVLSTNDTVKLRIDEIIADSWDTGTAMTLTADTDLHIGRVRAVGAPSTPSKDGIYVLNGVSAYFGDVEIAGSTQIGFRTYNCGRVDFGKINSHGNALDQVRIESPGFGGEIVVSDGGTGSGVLIQGAANGLSVGRIESDGGGMIQITADDVLVPEIISENNSGIGSGYGLWLNGCDRFVNRRLLVDGNTQGLRLSTIVDTTMGAMTVTNNDYGVVGSSVTGWSYDNVVYSGNVNYDSNIVFETLSGFKGKRVRQSVGSDRGDAGVTLTVGVDAVTQRFATTLTAARTITLSTTGAQNGDRFRIVRPATGAFNLNVGSGPLKALAAGQWCEVEFVGAAWVLTAYGSL